MSNDITTLREHLFATLEALKDKENPMDIDRARAVADTAQVIINTAKAEIDYLRVTGGKGSGFIPEAPVKLPAGTSSPRPGVLVHRMEG